MSTKQSQNQSENRKKLLKSDLKEGLEGLKEIFVATLALIIRISESSVFSDTSSSLSKFRKRSSNNNSQSALSFVKDNPSNETSEALDISVEVEKNTISKKLPLLIQNLLYPVLAIIGTISVVNGVNKMEPMREWANTQNECISNTQSIEGITKEDLATKVMKCNGGHAF